MTDRNKFSFYLLVVTTIFTLNAYGAEGDERPFEMLIRTTNTGISSDTEFLIQTDDPGYNYNVDCDNDGNLEATGVTGDYTCNYTVAGDYIISISGTFPQLYFVDSHSNSDSEKVIDILQWGTQVWRSMEQACFNCKNMIMTATDRPNLSQVTSMRQMFLGASKFNQYIGDWDVSHVTNMLGMFDSASSFNQSISDWNVSSVTDMSFMFHNASSFNQYIGDWDVSNVTDMSWMFFNADSFIQSISDWDVSKVTNMARMFEFATFFNQYIGDWDVSHVTNMTLMFRDATSFNQYIGDWDVSKVTNMSSMFEGASSFNQYIGDWDVSEVDFMRDMFSGVTSFNQYIGDWDVSKVPNMSNMLESTALSTTNYDYILYNWSLLTNLQRDVTLDVGDTQYSEAGVAFRQQLIDDFNWTINDGGLL
jgi:surface protein